MLLCHLSLRIIHDTDREIVFRVASTPSLRRVTSGATKKLQIMGSVLVAYIHPDYLTNNDLSGPPQDKTLIFCCLHAGRMPL
jgi:hypothetical protein